MTPEEIATARDGLVKAIAAGVLTYRDQNSELITYQSVSQMREALALLDRQGVPLSSVRFVTSKGLERDCG